MRTFSSVALVLALAGVGCGVDRTDAALAAPGNNLTTPVAAMSDPAATPEDPTRVAPVVPRNDAEAAPRYREVTIPAGTRISVRLGSAVSSRTSGVEDTIRGTLTRSVVVGGVSAIPAGAALTGQVTEARRSGRVKGRARVGFRFTGLHAQGSTYTVQTATIARQARGTKKRDAIGIGAATGAGALIGGLTGGKKGAAIGSAVGAGGGTGVVLATRGAEVTVPAGTVVTTRLTRPLTVRVEMP